MINTSSQPSYEKKGIKRLLQHAEQAVMSFQDLFKTPVSTIMTMLVLGVSLALPATMYIVLKNTNSITQQWSSPAEINLFLKKELSETRYNSLVKRIENYKEVESVVYISKQQGMDEFSKTAGFPAVARFLDSNPLPAVVVVTPKPYYRTAIAAQELLIKLERESEVEQARLDITWLARLDGMIALFKDAVFVVSALLLSAVLLITGNTIRLSILSQRTEIEIMKLVGATDSFVRRPFLYSGFWYGMLGGMLAWIISTVMAFWMEDAVIYLTQLYQTEFTIQGLDFLEVIILLIVSLSLGLLSAGISVKHYIAKIEPS